MFIALVAMALVSQASSIIKMEATFIPKVKPEPETWGINASVLKSIQMLPVACFEVTFYLSCGYHWAGNLCVSGSGPVLTSEQFITGWNHKNQQLCPGAPWIP
ncbi:hypothetical protein CAP36_16995 [Chitinophagaceae bacterium IBVUCB2]|nr:hypothetical protein CAP36_16995 [Chitinophagaceae bacterium IBVUCB2]